MNSFLKNMLFVITLITFFTCNSTKEITDGSLAFKLKKYQLAKKLLANEIPTAKDDKKITKIFELVDSYKFSNDPKNAAVWIQKAIDESNKNELYFDMAMMQKQNEDYENAIISLEKYKKLTSDEFKSLPEIAICKKIAEEKDKQSNMSVENLTKINSSYSDYSATIYKGNQIIISSSRKTATGTHIHPWNGEKNSDLFLVNLNNNTVSNFDSTINTISPEANITFNKKFDVAYFTRCDFSKNIDENGYCHIFKTEKDGNEWYPAEKIPLFDDKTNVGQAFLSHDEKRLYFSAEYKDSYGGKDIYFVEIKNGEYGSPINAGSEINTKANELFPTTDSKGTLYFSTSGRTGFGGLDIFKAKENKNGFEKAEQLPWPINSGADDFYLVYSKEMGPPNSKKILEKAYFSSSRKGGKGNDDIYMYKKEFINILKLELLVQEKSFKDPTNNSSELLGLIPIDKAEVTLFDFDTNIEKLNSKSDNEGISTTIMDNNYMYKVLVSKKGYFNKSIKISTIGIVDPNKYEIIVKAKIELEKIFPEKEIVIDNIYYDLNKASLRDDSKSSLDKLVSFFEENNDLTIEIGSHTDSRGSDIYNEDLSQKRAQSVVDYFINKGIPKTQLIAKGYGETKILNKCLNDIECTDEEHQANRRTSFRVVSSNGVLESK